jgi:predicted signal transduction protein with EAL and GGDEF domain
MVLVDLPTEQSAVHAVERIISVLGQPLLIEGKEIFAHCSIGIAFAGDPADGPVTPDQLLRNADAAMYVVKTDGKGRYAVYQPHMHAAALHRLDLRADLQRALDNGEFVLHYQPIVSMTSGLTVGVEALVRWMHRSAAWSRRTRSSRSRRRPASSSLSGSGCSRPRAGRSRRGRSTTPGCR